MDSNQPRDRSPSQGNRHIHGSVQASSQYHDSTAGFGLDPAVSNQTFTTGRFNTSQHFPTPLLESTQPQNQFGTADTNLYPHNQFNQNAFQGVHFPGQTLDPSFTNNEFMFQSNGMQTDFDSNSNLFPSEPMFEMAEQNNINPAELSNISKISSPQEHTSPNLLSPEAHSSPGIPPSPTSTNGQFYTPQHSRHTSLDPSSAYSQSQNDWQSSTFQNFQHRRAPSDHSDVSSNAGASPYLGQKEVFDSIETGHSPFMSAQPDGSSTFGIEAFSLGDQSHASPAHTPYISPRLMPTHNQGLGLAQDVMLGQNHMGMPGPEIYPSQSESTYPNMVQVHARNGSTISDMGQADQFAPPTINIEPAPISRQPSFEPENRPSNDALLPPGNRGRSKSDLTGVRPNSLSRSTSPSGRSPNPRAEDSLSVRSHSPGARSRDSSPGVESGRIDKNRRASTSSINSRDYILDLADPGRPNATQSSQSSRVQKHPATFQCHQCPKRFTRAYNLRSHLRTHTNERPFVCNVCGKAFARQHDRKRHEGLHSGEKKFICRGELQRNPGHNWGCGRRFARADALGRHFRSEAGRVCIKPLLDEEAAEREENMMMMEQQQQTQFMQGDNLLRPVTQPMMFGNDHTANTGNFTLPAVLLAQYPALQNIDWSQVPSANDDPGELSDVGYNDVGGQGGYFEDGEDDGGYVSGGAMMQNHSGQNAW